MPGILGAPINPLGEKLFGGVVGTPVSLRRRHHHIRIVREETAHHLTLLGVSRYDRAITGTGGRHGGFSPIESQTRLARILVGPMARITVVCQERLDIAPEIHGASGGHRDEKDAVECDGDSQSHDRAQPSSSIWWWAIPLDWKMTA